MDVGVLLPSLRRLQAEFAVQDWFGHGSGIVSGWAIKSSRDGSIVTASRDSPTTSVLLTFSVRGRKTRLESAVVSIGECDATHLDIGDFLGDESLMLAECVRLLQGALDLSAEDKVG